METFTISAKPSKEWSQKVKDGCYESQCDLCGRPQPSFHSGQYINIVEGWNTDTVVLALIDKDAKWTSEFDSVGNECAKKIPRQYRLTQAQVKKNGCE